MPFIKDKWSMNDKHNLTVYKYICWQIEIILNVINNADCNVNQEYNYLNMLY